MSDDIKKSVDYIEGRIMCLGLTPSMISLLYDGLGRAEQEIGDILLEQEWRDFPAGELEALEQEAARYRVVAAALADELNDRNKANLER
jgi:hypothetical protein